MCQHRSALQFLFMIVELFFLNSFVDDGVQCAREIVKLNLHTSLYIYLLCNGNKIFEMLLLFSHFWQLKTFKICFFSSKISPIKKRLIYTHPCNCHLCNTCATMGFVECKALEWGDIKV